MTPNPTSAKIVNLNAPHLFRIFKLCPAREIFEIFLASTCSLFIHLSKKKVVKTESFRILNAVNVRRFCRIMVRFDSIPVRRASSKTNKILSFFSFHLHLFFLVGEQSIQSKASFALPVLPDARPCVSTWFPFLPIRIARNDLCFSSWLGERWKCDYFIFPARGDMKQDSRKLSLVSWSVSPYGNEKRVRDHVCRSLE